MALQAILFWLLLWVLWPLTENTPTLSLAMQYPVLVLCSVIPTGVKEPCWTAAAHTIPSGLWITATQRTLGLPHKCMSPSLGEGSALWAPWGHSQKVGELILYNTAAPASPAPEALDMCLCLNAASWPISFVRRTGQDSLPYCLHNVSNSKPQRG